MDLSPVEFGCIISGIGEGGEGVRYMKRKSRVGKWGELHEVWPPGVSGDFQKTRPHEPRLQVKRRAYYY